MKRDREKNSTILMAMTAEITVKWFGGITFSINRLISHNNAGKSIIGWSVRHSQSVSQSVIRSYRSHRTRIHIVIVDCGTVASVVCLCVCVWVSHSRLLPFSVLLSSLSFSAASTHADTDTDTNTDSVNTCCYCCWPYITQSIRFSLVNMIVAASLTNKCCLWNEIINLSRCHDIM